MKKVEAIKDGKGNVVIAEDSFEMLLACLDNQKFIGEGPQNGDSISVGKEEYYKTQQDIQDVINEYNRECRKILHQKLVFETKEKEYFLQKRYEHQKTPIDWFWDEVLKVREIFKDTKMKWEKPDNLKPLDGNESIMAGTKPIGKTEDGFIVCDPGQIPWLIERNTFTSESNLTISEDGKNNRPWKEEEIIKIEKLFKN